MSGRIECLASRTFDARLGTGAGEDYLVARIQTEAIFADGLD